MLNPATPVIPSDLGATHRPGLFRFGNDANVPSYWMAPHCRCVPVPVACLSPLRACPRCVPVPVVCLSPLCACPRCVPVPVVWMAPLCACPRCVDGPVAWMAPLCGWPHIACVSLPTFQLRCHPPFSDGATHRLGLFRFGNEVPVAVPAIEDFAGTGHFRGDRDPGSVQCLSSLRACHRCVPVPVVWTAPLCACPRCVDGPTLLAFRSPPFSCGATHLSVTHLSVTVPPTGSDCFVLATRFRRRCQPVRVSLEPVISAETGIQGACNACPRCVLVAWDSRAIHRPAFILPPG